MKLTRRQQAQRKATLVNDANRLVRKLINRQIVAARREYEYETYTRVTRVLSRAQTRLARREVAK